MMIYEALSCVAKALNAYLPYGVVTNSPINPGDDIKNTNVKLADFEAALLALKKQQDVTMYVVPGSTLLSDGDYRRDTSGGIPGSNQYFILTIQNHGK